jgi:AraC family transcriptional regulator
MKDMHTRAVVIPGFRLQTGVYEAGAEIPRHSHVDPTLCFLINGRFTEYSRSRAIDCGNGTLKLTPAGEDHWNRFVAPETLGLRVDIDRGRFEDAPAIASLLDDHRTFDMRGPRAVMHRLVAELRTNDDASRLVLEGLLLELFGELGRSPAGNRTGLPSWLLRADETIRERFATNISLSRVASIVGIAPVTLARAYRATYHVSIGERVRQLRLEKAAEALVSGRDPISIVAVSAGFYDQSHFTTAFRRQYAMTPARFRALGTTENTEGKRGR